MKDWKKAVVPLDGTMRDVIHSLNESAQQMVLVVDGDWRLKGVITDGDIRRGLLAGLSLESAASQVMNTKFFFTRPEDDEKELLETMQRLEFHHAPVLDADGRLLGLRNLFEMVSTPRRDNWVVLMAGGLGSRLRPLTEDCPKPCCPWADGPSWRPSCSSSPRRASGISSFP
jgi:Mg/Co/Ni transporter MgtE